jgi:hypothetical protein
VLVDGPAEQANLFAARLAEELGTRKRPVQVTLDANRPRDVSIFLRTAPGGRHFPVYRKDSGDGAGHDARDRREREELAGHPAGGRAARGARLVVPDRDARVLRLSRRDLGRQVRRRPARVLRGG